MERINKRAQAQYERLHQAVREGNRELLDDFDRLITSTVQRACQEANVSASTTRKILQTIHQINEAQALWLVTFFAETSRRIGRTPRAKPLKPKTINP